MGVPHARCRSRRHSPVGRRSACGPQPHGWRTRPPRPAGIEDRRPIRAGNAIPFVTRTGFAASPGSRSLGSDPASGPPLHHPLPPATKSTPRARASDAEARNREPRRQQERAEAFTAERNTGRSHQARAMQLPPCLRAPSRPSTGLPDPADPLRDREMIAPGSAPVRTHRTPVASSTLARDDASAARRSERQLPRLLHTRRSGRHQPRQRRTAKHQPLGSRCATRAPDPFHHPYSRVRHIARPTSRASRAKSLPVS